MAPTRSYKNYFRKDNETPRGIPRRTLSRAIRPRKLQLEFEREANVNVVVASHSSNNFDEIPSPVQFACSDTSLSSPEETSQSNNALPDQITVEEMLFAGSRISRAESLQLIYGFIIRHKLSTASVADLLTLLNFHLPCDVTVPTSTFLLEKELSPDFSTAKKTVFCPSCENVLIENKCQSCDKFYSEGELLGKSKFFLLFNLRCNLEKLVSLEVVKQSLLKNLNARNRRQNGDGIEDISSGESYKKLPLRDNDFTCTINTDGVSVFKSSRYSVWPLLVSINELDYHLRRKYTVVAGLWFGFKKPNFDSFLDNFVDQCNELSCVPITWKAGGEELQSKVYFPIVSADSVARCLLQGIKQFNGEYGCPWCLVRGEYMEPSDHGGKWIYPPATNLPRTKANFLQHLRILQSNLEEGTNRACYGLKHASQLIKLKHFDIVEGFVFDYMHSGLLGVVKTITLTWFDSKNHRELYYLGLRATEISTRFTHCKVPHECNRVTRDLSDKLFWKANEWKTWMLLAVPVLHNILPAQYLNHFSKLVCSFSILNSSSITQEDLKIASKLLKSFCDAAPNLYGRQICTFNMHILGHAVDCVRRWGPLWSYSLFQFENVNGIISSHVTGTFKAHMQIVRKIVVIQQVVSKGTLVFKNKLAKHFYESLLDNKKFCVKFFRCDSNVLLGPCKLYVFNEHEQRLLRDWVVPIPSRGASYKSVIVNKRRFNVQSRDTANRSNSVCRIHGFLYAIVKILVVQDQAKNNIPIVLTKRITTSLVAGLRRTYKVIKIGQSVNCFRIGLIERVKFLCVYSETNLLTHVVEMFNLTELE